MLRSLRCDHHGQRSGSPRRAAPRRRPGAGDDVVVPVGRRDRDAEFTAFVTRHQADLLRTAWLLVGDGHRAEELTQQALVRTYTAWERAGSGDPLAYARRVLVNLRVDTWRRRRREVLVAPEEMPEGAGPGRADTADATADRDQLVRALATLTPRQRRVVVLRHLVGLPEAEVAADLGVSVGTVKSTSSRALADLRTRLALHDAAPATSPRSTR
ncbi:SigE family RNA polymerase sigma factor [Actinotalea solisilvae]|uniref:SigE family RNA polymerase sigma factor n=1 Tax=Actinotalea solisilvae TaxID=2072922 RepID=UPI0027DE115D|nr:SigE family RNA polymerase sigma factor [Actinotalea solisilvae]